MQSNVIPNIFTGSQSFSQLKNNQQFVLTTVTNDQVLSIKTSLLEPHFAGTTM